MKPKTKLQLQVWELSCKLPSISEVQKEWGIKHCLDHNGFRTKKGISCLDCGHKWKDNSPVLLQTILGVVCPNCNTHLKIHDTRKQKAQQGAYYGIITTFSGFQVLRYFEIWSYHRVGTPISVSCKEVAQIWISPIGKFEIVAKVHYVTMYIDSWTGRFEIRDKRNAGVYDINPYKFYPQRKYIPEIKRNGFKGSFHRLTPSRIFRLILSDSKAETLLKAKQFELLRHRALRPTDIDNNWNSIKICIRNNYIIPDASMYIDYLDQLRFFEKDLLSPKYICPSELKREHDRLSDKRMAIRQKQAEQEKIQKAIEAEKLYKDQKERFFDVEFSDGTIRICVLKSVHDFYEESKAMHHCVFSSGYYLKPDSLILSAMIEDKRIETIEFSLKNGSIVQSRGVCNQTTEYHQQIIDLVNKHRRSILKRLTA